MLILFGLALVERQSNKYAYTAYNKAQAYQQETVLSNSGNPQAADPAANSGETENSNEHSFPLSIPLDDLIQQSRMAEATEDVAIYALIGIVMTGIGLALVVTTLYYTGEAANHTAQMLAVANETLEETRSSTKIELRAYITVDEILSPNLHDESREFEYVVILSNTGQSPAKNVKIRFLDIRIKTQKPAMSKKAWARSRPERKILGTVGAGRTGIEKNFDGRISLGNQQAGVWLGMYTIYVIGIIEYDDIFGRHHHTNFRYKVSPLKRSVEACEIGNSST